MDFDPKLISYLLESCLWNSSFLEASLIVIRGIEVCHVIVVVVSLVEIVISDRDIRQNFSNTFVARNETCCVFDTDSFTELLHPMEGHFSGLDYILPSFDLFLLSNFITLSFCRPLPHERYSGIKPHGTIKYARDFLMFPEHEQQCKLSELSD